MAPPKHSLAPSSGLQQQQLGPPCPTPSPGPGKQPGPPTPPPGLWALEQGPGPKTQHGRVSNPAAEHRSSRRPPTPRIRRAPPSKPLLLQEVGPDFFLPRILGTLVLALPSPALVLGEESGWRVRSTQVPILVQQPPERSSLHPLRATLRSPLGSGAESHPMN